MKGMFVLVMTLVTLMASNVFAADMKVGYVDIKTAMENSKEYHNGMKRLEALQKKKKRELEAMRSKLQGLDKELQLQSMTLSNDNQAAKQQEFTKLKKEFDRKLQDASDELKNEKRKLDSRLIGKFYNTVRAYGKEHKYDVILPKNATIYTSGNQDITAEITKILDTKK